MSNTNSTVALGNTITKAKRSRGWCFTLNNYTEEDFNKLKDTCTQFCKKFIIGKEVGKKGTPHLQGYVYFQDGKTFDAVKQLLGTALHLEKAKGTAEQNKKYCGKDENYIMQGFDTTDKEAFDVEYNKRIQERKSNLLINYENISWKRWQNDVLQVLEQEPDSRTIHWVFDPIGNSGKSFLTKYLYLTRKIIIADGKKDNVFNQVLQMVMGDKKNKILPEDPEIVILDIPRSSEGYINYGVLEQLKNGLIYSGKYEGGICAFGNVHVIVMANFEPDMSQFSIDRWHIINV